MRKIALGLLLMMSPVLVHNTAFAKRDVRKLGENEQIMVTDWELVAKLLSEEPSAKMDERSDHTMWIVGGGAALMAAWGYAGYMLLNRQVPRANVQPRPVVRIVLNVAAVGAAIGSVYMAASAVYGYYSSDF